MKLEKLRLIITDKDLVTEYAETHEEIITEDLQYGSLLPVTSLLTGDTPKEGPCLVLNVQVEALDDDDEEGIEPAAAAELFAELLASPQSSRFWVQSKKVIR